MKTVKCNECGSEFDVADDDLEQEVELCPRCENIEDESDQDEIITGEESENPAEKMD